MQRERIFVIVCLILIITWIVHDCRATRATRKDIQNILQVEKKSLTTNLFYAGTIQPAQTTSVISPSDGTIEAISFHFGDKVKAGQLLLSLSSEKFFTDYKNALMQYIKAKSDFDNNQNQFKEGEFLHKNLLISDDDYKSRQSNYYNSELSFVQAKDALTNMLKLLQIKDLKLTQLSIQDIQKVIKAMHVQNASQQLKIYSPLSGIILQPVKADNSSEKHIDINESVKQGDVLALVGDDQQFTVTLNINEFDINQIKIGQKVKVTGPAFPDFVLTGKIIGVDHQAQVNQNGIPNFTAQVLIDKLSPAEAAVIHVGMSAKVEVELVAAPLITIPISAVKEKNGRAYVDVINDKGRIIPTEIETGKTTQDSVNVTDHLHAGEKILLHPTSTGTP